MRLMICSTVCARLRELRPLWAADLVVSCGRVGGGAPVELRYRIGVVLQRNGAPAGMPDSGGGVGEVEARGKELARIRSAVALCVRSLYQP
jgi:hypothetical protein